MAFTYGFYNAVDHDRRYDAIQMGQIFDGIIKDGVYETYKKAMIVKESSRDNEVIVQPGRAWFNHTWSYNDADRPVSAYVQETALDRYDALVLDINAEQNVRANSIIWVKGQAANSPQWPALTNTATHHQYPLCYVYRHGGQPHIYQRDITNMVGTSACPFVTGVIEGLNIDDLLARWTDEFGYYITSKQQYFDNWMYTEQASFNNWKNQQQSQFFAWIENVENHFQTSFNNWFSHLQNELNANQAANLQRQIDAISYMYAIEPVLYLPNTAASVGGSRLILTNHN